MITGTLIFILLSTGEVKTVTEVFDTQIECKNQLRHAMIAAIQTGKVLELKVSCVEGDEA